LAITPPSSAGAPNLACVGIWRATGIDRLGLAILLRDPGRVPEDFFIENSPYRALIAEARERGIELLVSVDAEDLTDASEAALAVHVRGTPQAVQRPVDGRSAHLVDLDHPERCALPTRYWTFAPVFPTSNAGKFPVGLDALQRACEVLQAPVLALGGVHAAQAEDCFAAGAHGIAGISSFFGPLAQVETDTNAFVSALAR
jgi:thiamine monophosphate synthase